MARFSRAVRFSRSLHQLLEPEPVRPRHRYGTRRRSHCSERRTTVQKRRRFVGTGIGKERGVESQGGGGRPIVGYSVRTRSHRQLNACALARRHTGVPIAKHPSTARVPAAMHSAARSARRGPPTLGCWKLTLAASETTRVRFCKDDDDDVFVPNTLIRSNCALKRGWMVWVEARALDGRGGVTSYLSSQ